TASPAPSISTASAARSTSERRRSGRRTGPDPLSYGPRMISIHPTALVASRSIGDGTRIWAFVNILAGARIGRDCNICDRCFIENDVVLGDRVTVKCGVSLYDGLAIENEVFVGPDVVFANDPRPRSGKRLPAY